jgi:hypothetical protein
MAAKWRALPRIGDVYWWGTADELYRYLAPPIPEIILVPSLNGDYFVGSLTPEPLVFQMCLYRARQMRIANQPRLATPSRRTYYPPRAKGASVLRGLKG